MLVLLTRRPRLLSFETLKAAIKKILNQSRGPQSVLRSLKRGLQKLNFPYRVNVKPQPGDTVHVLSSVHALRYAIDLKKKGLIDQLVAGPNLMIIPSDHDRILASPEIDKILTVSDWTRDFYAAALPEVSNKIEIYPSGVQIPKRINLKDRKGAVVFKKVTEEKIFKTVEKELDMRNIPYTTFFYGSFDQEEYFAALEKAEFMVYLQEVESQGIALQEAWARNVPTLVWNKGTFTYPTGQTVTGNIAAPFLTEHTGMFFAGAEEFPSTLTLFLLRLPTFSARQYCEHYLSDKATAETYVKILESIK
jgi:hypothetical protein